MDVLRVIKRTGLSSSQKLVLLYIVHPEFENISQVDHAELLRMSVRCFGAAVRALRIKGYIDILKGEFNPLKGKGPDHYVATKKARELTSVK